MKITTRNTDITDISGDGISLFNYEKDLIPAHDCEKYFKISKFTMMNGHGSSIDSYTCSLCGRLYYRNRKNEFVDVSDQFDRIDEIIENDKPEKTLLRPIKSAGVYYPHRGPAG